MTTRPLSVLVQLFQKQRTVQKKAIQTAIHRRPDGTKLVTNPRNIFIAQNVKSKGDFAAVAGRWKTLPAAEKAALQKQADANRTVVQANKAKFARSIGRGLFVKEQFAKGYKGKTQTDVTTFFRDAAAKWAALPAAEKQRYNQQAQQKTAAAVAAKQQVVAADAKSKAIAERIAAYRQQKTQRKAKRLAMRHRLAAKRATARAAKRARAAKKAQTAAAKQLARQKRQARKQRLLKERRAKQAKKAAAKKKAAKQAAAKKKAAAAKKKKAAKRARK